MVAYLLEKAKLDQILQGKFFIQEYHQFCYEETEESHAFIKYEMEEGVEVIMDPAQNTFFPMSNIENEDCVMYKKYLHFSEQRRHNLAPLLI